MDIPINISTGDVIVDIVLGFIMLTVYNFVNYNKLLDNGITTIFSSFVLGYIFRAILRIIPINFGFIDFIGMGIGAVIISYAAALLVKSPKIEKMIDFLKIRRSTNHIIWLDLLDMKYTSKIKVNMPNGCTYVGYLYVGEEYTQTPIISLYGYKILNTENSRLYCDYSHIPNRVIVLDTGKADSVEIIYGRNSEKANLIKPFLETDIENLYEYPQREE